MAAQCGVQGILLAESSKATYVHPGSHVLNMYVVQACTLQVYLEHEWCCQSLVIFLK